MIKLAALSHKTKPAGLPSATFLILGFVCYQFFLCFANTNLFVVSNTLVAITETTLLAWAALKIFPTCRFNEIAFALFLLIYFMLLGVARGDLDLEGPRNVFVILVAFALGRAAPDRQAANKMVWLVSAIVLFFAAAEYFLTDSYLKLFDILHYYVARGIVTDDVQSWVQQNYFVSGFRPAGRNILPILGDQRISSVFLEPVSMGNYAIILCLWALSFDAGEKRRAFGHFVVAVILIIACDSRFASLLVFLLLLLRFVPIARRREALLLLPVLAVGGLLLFTHFGLGNADDDNVTGRLMRSGVATLGLSFTQLLGIGTLDNLGDMGIAYSFEHLGLFLCIALWLIFVTPALKDDHAQRYRMMLAVYAFAILLISGTSFYSSKTSVLAWFLYGVLCGERVPLKTERKADA